MADVFVSYARKDTERAKLIVDALSNEGISVWWDRYIPSGENWDKMIEAELFNARCALVLWSRHSVASENCRCEADFARGAGILIPALLEPCEIPLFHRMVQYSDIRAWAGSTNDRLWTDLVERIKLHLRTHSAPDPRAALGRWGFGIAPPKRNTWKRYNSAATAVATLLEDQQIDDKEIALAALSEAKGLFNRVRRKDQWDWFIVWQRLGFPNRRDLWPIVEGLQSLCLSVRDDLVEEFSGAFSKLNELRVSSYLRHFAGDEQAVEVVGRGLVFVLSAKSQSDVLFVGATEGNAIEIADQLSHQLGAKQPFGIVAGWRVRDVDDTRARVFEELTRNGFASPLDRVLSGIKVVDGDYKRVLPIIEAVLEDR